MTTVDLVYSHTSGRPTTETKSLNSVSTCTESNTVLKDKRKQMDHVQSLAE